MDRLFTLDCGCWDPEGDGDPVVRENILVVLTDAFVGHPVICCWDSDADIINM